MQCTLGLEEKRGVKRPSFGSEFIDFKPNPAEIEAEFWCAALDKDGLFWFESLDGLVQFDGSEFRLIQLPGSKVKETGFNISPNHVRSLIIDRSDKLWIGTDGSGLYLCNLNSKDSSDPKAFQPYTPEEGLCGTSIARLLENKQGTTQIGSAFGGLCRLNQALASKDNPSFQNFTLNRAVNGKEVCGLYEDP